MAKDGFAAVELGRLIGASAQEVNRLLADQGFLEKVNGVWALTSKGGEFATQVMKTSSNLPQAKRWDATYWRESILEVVDTSAPALAKVRTALTDERAARGAALRAARIEADAVFIASQTADVVKAASRGLNGKVVGYGLAGVAALTAAGLAIALPAYRARTAQRNAQNQAANDTTPQAEPDDEGDAP